MEGRNCTTGFYYRQLELQVRKALAGLCMMGTPPVGQCQQARWRVAHARRWPLHQLRAQWLEEGSCHAIGCALDVLPLRRAPAGLGNRSALLLDEVWRWLLSFMSPLW